MGKLLFFYDAQSNDRANIDNFYHDQQEFIALKKKSQYL